MIWRVERRPGSSQVPAGAANHSTSFSVSPCKAESPEHTALWSIQQHTTCPRGCHCILMYFVNFREEIWSVSGTRNWCNTKLVQCQLVHCQNGTVRNWCSAKCVVLPTGAVPNWCSAKRDAVQTGAVPNVLHCQLMQCQRGAVQTGAVPNVLHCQLVQCQTGAVPNAVQCKLVQYQTRCSANWCSAKRGAVQTGAVPNVLHCQLAQCQTRCSANWCSANYLDWSHFA